MESNYIFIILAWNKYGECFLHKKWKIMTSKVREEFKIKILVRCRKSKRY